MAIQMTCPCGTNLTFEDAQLGQSGPCYQCGQTLTVAPTAASPMAAQPAFGQAPAPQPQFGGPSQAPGAGAYGGGPGSGPGGEAFSNPAVSSSGAGSQSKDGWSWHYSRLVGVMYGPIPVGIIAVVVCGLIYGLTQL